MIGPDIEAEEMDEEITGPEEVPEPGPERSDTGHQLIVHVEDPDDAKEAVAAAKEAWKAARKAIGLD